MAEPVPVLLTSTQIVLAGVELELEAATADGNYFPCSGKDVFVINNASASPVTVTFDSKRLVYGTDVNPAVVIPAGETHLIGPFLKERFDDGDGYVHLTYSAVTDVTVGVFKLSGVGY